jgi:hypothetical protein
MIVTISDESNYLLSVTKYMILSLAKYMPNEKLFVIIVNGEGKYDDVIKQWHPNLYIEHYKINGDNKKGLYFTFMVLPLYNLLTKYNEPLIYIDGDTIIRNSLDSLFDELLNVDIMVRYRPNLDFIGPIGSKYGARINSGIVALSNNKIVKEFVKEFRNKIINFIDSGKEPIAWNKEKTSLTGVDQELLWLLIEEYKDKIKFFPLNDKYNDSYFISSSSIWHAKGVTRTYPEYLIECYKYGRKDVNIVKEYIRLYYRKFKKLVKSFLMEPLESFKIKELEDILQSVEIKSIVIVNSDFYLDNETVLKNKLIECYDTDPVIYYKNKIKLKNKNILHKYIVYDTQSIKNQNINLLICEEKNLKVTTLLDYETKIIKE